MDFCPKCGCLLVTKKVKSGGQVCVTLVCSKCGQKVEETEDNLKIKVKIIEHNPRQMVSVIDKEIQLITLPTIQVICARCGNNNAHAWQVQTRGADESSTQFLRCTRCNYTFRESS